MILQVGVTIWVPTKGSLKGVPNKCSARGSC